MILILKRKEIKHQKFANKLEIKQYVSKSKDGVQRITLIIKVYAVSILTAITSVTIWSIKDTKCLNYIFLLLNFIFNLISIF